MTRAWLVTFLAAGCTNVVDSDCERVDQIEAFADLDGDGFGAGDPQMVCAIGEGQSDNRIDCDDDNELVHPDATEACNQVDDNCDGQVDESFQKTVYYADVDGDGYGALFPAVATCGTPPSGFVNNAQDCDDDLATINPAALEVCNDGVDDNCDGRADDADPNTSAASKTTYYTDFDADGFGDLQHPVDLCKGRAGIVDNYVDCNDRNADITNYPFPEDADFDGYGDEIGTVMSCEGYPGTADNRIDCDDSDPWVNIPKNWYNDADGDGWGLGDPESFGCFPPNGLSVGPNVGDCDDENPDISPGTEEICTDGIDQNCNDQIDCADRACSIQEQCWGDCVDVGIASEPTITVALGDINQYGKDFTIPCTYGTGADVVVQWIAPEAGTWEFNTFGSDSRYGPFIGLYESCEAESSYACGFFSYYYDGTYQNYYQARLTNISLDEGELVIIKLDSYYGYTDDAVLNIIQR